MKFSDQEFSAYFPFKTARHNQKEVIEQIITAYLNGKHHVVLNAPTGTGKSVIAVTVANYLYELFSNKSYRLKARIVTSQKCLQEQYNHDLNIPIIFGKSNYTCNENPQLTCDEGICRGTNKECSNCPYATAKNLALGSKVCAVNYAFHLLSIRRQMQLPGFTIFDECHSLEDEVLKTYTATFSVKRLNYLGFSIDTLPSIDMSLYNYTVWLKEILTQLKIEVTKETAILKVLKNFKAHQKKELKEFKQHMNRYGALLRTYIQIEEILSQFANGNTFTVSGNSEQISIKLLHGACIFNRHVANTSRFFLHMSATPPTKEQYCKSIGLDPNDVEYIACDSTFPIVNRPIFFDHTVGLMTYAHKRTTLPKMVNRIDEILRSIPNEKGIIHTVSYEITEAIMSGLSDDQSWRILCPNAENKQKVLSLFYTSDEPYVLMSPSLTEGLDLKEELSRFCIICKIPYGNTQDKWIKTRMEQDYSWYCSNACSIIMQMTGRSVRSETDRAVTYVLDGSFSRLLGGNAHMFPEWWRNSVFSIDDEPEYWKEYPLNSKGT